MIGVGVFDVAKKGNGNGKEKGKEKGNENEKLWGERAISF
jgi:hypothetical protein